MTSLPARGAPARTPRSVNQMITHDGEADPQSVHDEAIRQYAAQAGTQAGADPATDVPTTGTRCNIVYQDGPQAPAMPGADAEAAKTLTALTEAFASLRLE